MSIKLWLTLFVNQFRVEYGVQYDLPTMQNGYQLFCRLFLLQRLLSFQNLTTSRNIFRLGTNLKLIPKSKKNRVEQTAMYPT